jgi:hypothetical protein
MTMENDALAQSVDYTDALQYLVHRGWQRVRSRTDAVAILRKGPAEVVLPLDRELGDYGEAIARAAARIAALEGGTAHSILEDLHHPRTDTLRAGRTDAGTEDGSLGFDAAAAMLAGLRRSLLASACSVERPAERFHRRMNLKRPQEFINKCRIGQTEHGSFVVTVLCPLELDQLELADPFGRKTVETLIGSVNKAVHLLRTDGAARVAEDVPALSANLCDALVDMMPKDERGDLWLGASWSPLLPAPALPTRVQIDRDLYAAFEGLARSLRPPTLPKVDLFVGRVVELHGEDNADGALEGDVLLVVQVGEELVRTRVALTAVEYKVAMQAHVEQRYLRVRGELHRQTKTASIEKPSDVQVIE